MRLSPAHGPLGRAALIAAFLALLMLPQWLVGGLLIAATALVEGFTVVSVDPIFDAYGVPRLW